MFTFLTEIFCQIDDFCKQFDQQNGKDFFLSNPSKKRNRSCNMILSEVMTIMVLFHMSDYRTFKNFYIQCVLTVLKTYFPSAVSYQSFVQLEQYALLPLTVFFNGLKGQESGIYYVDSTSIEVCYIK